MTNFQQFFNGPIPGIPGMQGPSIPGRVMRSVQRIPMPDGTMRERRMEQVTFQAPDGSIQTHETVTIEPPLSDGLVPEDLSDVLYCRLCKALVCLSAHGFQCGQCGMSYCTSCRVRIEVDKREVAVCKLCAEKAKIPAVLRHATRFIWGDES